jgi:hypothetical protein
MATKKKTKKEKQYSYDEYCKTFYPNPTLGQKTSPHDPKAFGRRLAEEVLKKVADSQHK